jgi:hypothetical protein
VHFVGLYCIMFSLPHEFNCSKRHSDTCSELKETMLRLTSETELFLAAMCEYVTLSLYVTNNFALFFTCWNSEPIVEKIFNSPRMFYFGGIFGWIKIHCEVFKTSYWKIAKYEICILCKLWVKSGVSLFIMLVGWKHKSVIWLKVILGWIFRLRRSLWLNL